jgi:hypothetical protein
MELPRDLCMALLDRAHRACLHRLRGIVQVLGGWATLGLPTQSPDEALRLRMVEVQEVTDWLDRLWHVQRDDPTDLNHPQIPEWMLAAAFRAGTPLEAKLPLPEILEPSAGLALSAWAEAVAGQCSTPKFALRMADDDRLLCRIQGSDLRTPSASLMETLSPWLTAEKLTDEHLGIGAGVLCTGLRLATPEAAEAISNRV